MAWSVDGLSAYRHIRYRGKEFIRTLKNNNGSDVVVMNASDEPFEKGYVEKEDPWDYATKPYEQAKYRQTLDILPPTRFRTGLEIACSEGVFTAQLASRVDRLVGTDISRTALERAKKRCRVYSHVSFQQLDLKEDPLPGQFDLMVCSEVLYFMGGRKGLEQIAHKLAAGLRPGGSLVMAHMNLVRDDPGGPGFDWKLEFGARVIEEVFQETFPLRLVRAMRYPLYRIHLFERKKPAAYFFTSTFPEIMEYAEQPTVLTPDMEAHVRWGDAGAGKCGLRGAQEGRGPVHFPSIEP